MKWRRVGSDGGYFVTVKNFPFVMWVPVTTAWRDVGLRMEETVSRYGE